MKKIILIGKTESGKTTLIQKIQSKKIEYKKTQTIENHYNFIDTPGEYLENRGYYSALMVTSYDADVIGFVQECGSHEFWLPPMFSSAFSKETIGIVTKIDLAKDDEDIKIAEEALLRAGVTRIFHISSFENKGIEEVVQFINGQ